MVDGGGRDRGSQARSQSHDVMKSLSPSSSSFLRRWSSGLDLHSSFSGQVTRTDQMKALPTPKALACQLWGFSGCRI